MEQLSVEVIMAHSPQAKGRVERQNGLLQDRLVKEMRLAKINNLEQANTFLGATFLPALNRKFNVPARSPADTHRPAPAALAEILSWEEERVAGQDWTVSWQNRWFQIGRENEKLSLAGRTVTVRALRTGQVKLLYQGRALTSQELPERPPRQPAPTRQTVGMKNQKPRADHPWRESGMAAGKSFWKKEKAAGAIVKRAAHQAAAASGPGSLEPVPNAALACVC